MKSVECIKCEEKCKHDKGDLDMGILPHYYCGECMIWKEDGEWTDGVDYWDSRGNCINYG
jgi:hypothetical protein